MFLFGDMEFESREAAQEWCDKRLWYAANDPSVLKAASYMGRGALKLPFSEMEVGDEVVFDIPAVNIQSRAHSYGQYSKKKFKTWKDWPCLVVKRVS